MMMFAYLKWKAVILLSISPNSLHFQFHMALAATLIKHESKQLWDGEKGEERDKNVDASSKISVP